MNIYSKKAYRFSLYKGTERVKSFDVRRNAFVGVPDWVNDDPLFKIALDAGNISIIDRAGNTNIDAMSAVMDEAKKLGIQNPGAMTLDQLQRSIADIRQSGGEVNELKIGGLNGEDIELPVETDKQDNPKASGEKKAKS